VQVLPVRVDVTVIELGEIVVVQLKQPPDDGPVVLERLGHPYVHPLIISRTVVAGGLRQPGSLAHSRRVGDNAGMAGDDSGADGCRQSAPSSPRLRWGPGTGPPAAGGGPWPRRLTVLAFANEAPLAVFFVVRAARAVQRRRPRIAAGSVLVAAGSVARLRAAAAEPLLQDPS